MSKRKSAYPALYDHKAIAEKLTTIAATHSGSSKLRENILDELKPVVQEIHENAKQHLFESGNGLSCGKALSAAQDQLINMIYHIAVHYVYPAENPSKSEHMAIIATGGYGRAALAPKSDIDLLFLLPYKQTAWGESVAEYVLYLLWDLGFKVGHATRSVDQCIQLSKSDITIRTAVLDARLITGNSELFDELVSRFNSDVVKGSSREFVEAKLEERIGRHEKTGKSRYLVEPNIKDGKGGLRDLHTLFWISKYVTEAENASDFIEAGIFSARESRNFKKCERFLWTIRCHLHFLTSRPEERLTFDVQQELADRLNYQDRGGRRAVERFMRHYFLIAKEVGALTQGVCLRMEIKEVKSAFVINKLFNPKLWSQKTEISEQGFQVVHNRLTITDRNIFEKDPVNIIRLFHVAEKYKLDLHPDVMRKVRSSWHLLDDDIRQNPEANEIFLELLCSPSNSEWVLRKMNEVGVLGRFIKDFGLVVCMMQFNMYHHFTVDEHLIKSIGILNRIESGLEKEAHPIASKVITKIRYRRALYVALFLHDVAKGREEDHSIEGAKIAREICPRLGMTTAETDTVSWLIEHHLAMSQTAQSRDINDPRTIQDFASLVQTRERLMLLTILTICDIRAVGPGVWNGWKRQLIGTLYYQTLPVVSGLDSEQTDHAIYAKNRFIAEFKDWPETEREAHVSRLAPSYWVRTELENQINHAQLLKQWESGNQEIASDIEVVSGADVTALTIIVANRNKNLLSKIAGACAGSGANIVGAQIVTTQDDIALDTILLQREFEYEADEIRRSKKILENFKKLVTGKKSLDAIKVDQRRYKKWENVFSVEPEVLIDRDLSDDYIVIEVVGLDKPGLLFEITKVFLGLNLDISSAHVATFGEKAVDTFYISNTSAGSIKDDSFIEKIKSELMKKLTNS